MFLMRRSLPLLQNLAPLTLGVSLFFVYSMTLAPGLSWANNGSDGGDLIAAAAGASLTQADIRSTCLWPRFSICRWLLAFVRI
jgi:hypothetical protein